MTYESASSIHLGNSTELTVMTPIRGGMIPGEIRTYEQRLQRVLHSLRKRAEGKISTPISQIPTIHFARWFIIRPEQYLRFSDLSGIEYEQFPRETSKREFNPAQPTLPTNFPVPREFETDFIELDDPSEENNTRSIVASWLMFTSNFDGELKAYIREFSTEFAEDLDLIWSNCEGYPKGGAAEFDNFWAYIQSFQIEVGAFFSAYPQLSTPRIHQLETFKQAFDAFVARTRQDDGSSIDGIGQALDEFTRKHQAYTEDFPGKDGIYDTQQASRGAALDKAAK